MQVFEKFFFFSKSPVLFFQLAVLLKWKVHREMPATFLPFYMERKKERERDGLFRTASVTPGNKFFFFPKRSDSSRSHLAWDCSHLAKALHSDWANCFGRDKIYIQTMHAWLGGRKNRKKKKSRASISDIRSAAFYIVYYIRLIDNHWQPPKYKIKSPFPTRLLHQRPCFQLQDMNRPIFTFTLSFTALFSNDYISA